MGNETIFYRTERNTIIYFVTEESVTGCKRYIKPRFWQKIKLPSFDADEDGLHINVVMIPALQKGWKKEKLLHLMHAYVSEKTAYLENADIILQHEVQLMSGQTDSNLTIAWSLAQKWIDDRRGTKKISLKDRRVFPEAVVLLLGNSLFPEEQMDKFIEMIQPCLSFINHLTILYEPNDDEDMDAEDAWRENESGKNEQRQNEWERYESEQDRWEETITEYTEALYYEYGLMAMVQRGSKARISRSKITAAQGGVLFLDFGYSGKIPMRAMREGDMYMDIFSSVKKEALFRQKCMEIYYISPRKYLDTLVKSGYDRLVNRTL